MPLFTIDHSNAGAQAGADSLALSAEVVGRLEEREQTLSLRQAELDQSQQRAAAYVQNQRAGQDLRRQELEFAKSQALGRHQTARMQAGQKQAELYADPQVSRALAFLQGTPEAEQLAALNPADPAFWQAVGRANLDADLADVQAKTERSLEINQQLEAQGLLPEGTAMAAAEAIGRGEDPAKLLQAARDELTKHGARASQQKAAGRLLTKYQTALGSADFVADQDPESIEEAGMLLDELEFLAEFDPGSERIAEIRTELAGALAPREVKAEIVRLREESAALQAQVLAMAQEHRSREEEQRGLLLDPVYAPTPHPAEEMAAGLAGTPLARPQAKPKGPKTRPVADLKPAQRIEAGNALRAWVFGPDSQALPPEEQEQAFEALALQLGIKGSLDELEALMRESEETEEREAPPGDPIKKAREGAKASGRYGSMGRHH